LREATPTAGKREISTEFGEGATDGIRERKSLHKNHHEGAFSF
jgi:hypothetical protein